MVRKIDPYYKARASELISVLDDEGVFTKDTDLETVALLLATSLQFYADLAIETSELLKHIREINREN